MSAWEWFMTGRNNAVDHGKFWGPTGVGAFRSSAYGIGWLFGKALRGCGVAN